MTKIVTLKSSDGQTFAVDEVVALKSPTIKNILEDIGAVENNAVSVPSVDGKTLAKVIEYCNKHAKEPSGFDEKAEVDEMEKWDAEFVDLLDREFLFDIAVAACVLNIRALIDLTCGKIADMIGVRLSNRCGRF
ncbi:hypothetical protein PVL29_026365 [Vitis rotundifolia]|uniref:SKP1-like protein n=1 Tax=Vitis rotundifolia TaxID=103349 RepID=A0AA38YM75_VITRO|nr:hypothetical protein PVL29_026365 [Vitis rotundifolia]